MDAVDAALRDAALQLDEPTLMALCDLVGRARERLLSGPVSCLAYPEGSGPTDWDPDKIDAINGDLLSGLSGSGNVYAIFVGQCGRWTATYVGQRKREKLRERIRQHMVKKHKKTGSQLRKVQRAVANGNKIGISYVLIEPESLRHFVEQSIIAARAAGELSWNKHR